ncbi:MAG: type VI secretion system ATPase TssH, partial [Firmicutes bacterium]|nr:type VI secretion system ATPase TssH [Bacillota bacterium]
MNIERYTQNAQNALIEAQNIAISSGHQQLDCEHINLALLKQRDGLIPRLLDVMGADTASIERDIQAELDKLPKVSGGADGLYSTRKLSELLIEAEKVAEQFKDEYVSVEHIYLALIAERGTQAAAVNAKYG